MNKQTIRDIDLKGKRALVRVDFNVPLDKKTNAITGDSRVKAVLPTVRYLIGAKARVILCSHLGRPDGKVVESMRLAPVRDRLAQLLGCPVGYVKDCVGAEVEAAVSKLRDGDILLLENLRFHPEEEENDPAFAKALARLADVYVDDAFGTAHRAHASTAGIAKYLPAVAGFLMEKEIEFLSQALEKPNRPFAAIIGGAKVSDKIKVLERILPKVDLLLIGGGMACTFLKAEGYEVGKSLVEEDRLDFARKLRSVAKGNGVRLLLPVDVVVADRFEAEAASKTVPIFQVPAGWYIVDIGAQTVEQFTAELKKCKTVLWNGPMGVFEFPAFKNGTVTLARLLAGLEATTIIGGGSTAEAIDELNLADKMTHVSTGGGASLKLLEGGTLPGVEVLLDKK